MKQDPDGTGRAAAHRRAAGGDADSWSPPAVGPTVAVIGDVHGQLTALRELLVSLGADGNTCELPHDLVIVQVGDLVHKGPDAPGVMDLVCRRSPIGSRRSGCNWLVTMKRCTSHRSRSSAGRSSYLMVLRTDCGIGGTAV